MRIKRGLPSEPWEAALTAVPLIYEGSSFSGLSAAGVSAREARSGERGRGAGSVRGTGNERRAAVV